MSYSKGGSISSFVQSVKQIQDASTRVQSRFNSIK